MFSEQGLSEKEARGGLVKGLAGIWERISNQTRVDMEFGSWRIVRGSDGTLGPIENETELRKKYHYRRVEVADLVFFTPYEDDRYFVGVRKLAQDIDQMILGDNVSRKKCSVLFVPESKYLPDREGVAAKRKVIVDMSSDDKWIAMCHELIHVRLGELYGASHCNTILEGATVFFTKKRFPLNPQHEYRIDPGFSEVLRLDRLNRSVGLSPTQMLENVGETSLDKSDIHAYTYRFGGFLAEYIVTRFGKETFFKFYQITSRDNLYNSQTGKTLIRGGKVQNGIRERDIIVQALRSVGLNPDQVEVEFDKFIKTETQRLHAL